MALTYKTFGPYESDQIPTPLTTPANVNIILMDGGNGDFDLNNTSHLPTGDSLGLSANDRVIFRFDNRVGQIAEYDTTSRDVEVGSGLTFTINADFSDDPQEIELLWTDDGTNEGWKLINAPGYHRHVHSVPDRLVGNGTAVDTAALTTLLTSGGVVTLPEGTFVLDAKIQVTNTGLTLKGAGRGKTVIKCTSPPSSSHTYLDFRSGAADITLEDLDIEWDSSTQPTGGANSILFALQVDNLTVRRVRFFGPGEEQTVFKTGVSPVELWGCDNVYMEDTEFWYSQGTNFGLNCLGGSNHTYIRCRWMNNAADGVKVAEHSTYGAPESFRFIACEMSYNGQQIMQGQDDQVCDERTSAPGVPEAVDGTRYLLNYSSSGSWPLPSSVAIGTKVLLSKKIGSAQVTISASGGDTIVGVIASGYVWKDNDDYKCILLTKQSSTQWLATFHTNGNGVDCYGTGHIFDGCLAVGNETTNFQVKPVSGNGAGHGIRFIGCNSTDSWNANGFAVVSEADDKPPAAGIHFIACNAWDNLRGSGFHFTTSLAPIYDSSMTHCVSRSNLTGVVIQSLCRNIVVDKCEIIGNGKGGSSSTSYNVVLNASKGTRIDNCHISGVDHIDQNLDTEAEINSATPRCRGILLYADYNDSAGEGLMEDVLIENCKIDLHDGGNDFVYFQDEGTSGDQSDFPPNLLRIRTKPVFGVGTIASATSSKSVSFATALPATPRASDIRVVFTSPLYTATFWTISSVSHTGFTIETWNTSGNLQNVGNDVDFEYTVQQL